MFETWRTPGRSGSNGALIDGDPGQRERAERRAVVGESAGDHLVAVVLAADLVVLAHELDDRVVRLGAAGAEERAVEVARGELGDLRRELDHARVGVAPVDEERQLGHLLGRRLAQLGAEAVARSGCRRAPTSRRSSACRCVSHSQQPSPRLMIGTSSRGVAALAREVHHQMPLRELLQGGGVGHSRQSFRGPRPGRPLDTVSNATGSDLPLNGRDAYTRRRNVRSSRGGHNGSSAKAHRPMRFGRSATATSRAASRSRRSSPLTPTAPA